MTIKHIIENIEKTEQNKCEVYINDLNDNLFNFNLYGYYEQTRLVSYYFGEWYCTDSKVGYKVYFLDDEPVAISIQLGRNCSENFHWVSEESYKKVRDYVLSFMDYENGCDKIDIIDMNEDFDDSYKINYYCQLYKHQKEKAIFNGETVKIIDFKDSHRNEANEYVKETVKIKFSNNQTKWVNTNELSFPYNVK